MNKRISASDVVPNGYQSKELPENTIRQIEETADRLAQLFQRKILCDEPTSISYDEKIENILTTNPWKWVAKGSERTVGCMGTTMHGEYIFDGEIGVVVKFNPQIRAPKFDQSTETETKQIRTIRETGNLYELGIWKQAVDMGHTSLFAPILDYSTSGDWIAQQYCIPVYTHNPTLSNFSSPIDYISRPKSIELAKEYRNRANEKGYSPHTKKGNIGINTQTGETVCIDYGSHFDIPLEDNELLESCLTNNTQKS